MRLMSNFYPLYMCSMHIGILVVENVDCLSQSEVVVVVVVVLVVPQYM